MSFSRFDKYVDRHARDFVERLQALCRMPSVAARGTGMRAIAEAVEQMLQRAGAGTRSYRIGNGHSVVFGECGAGQHNFLVYGHYDVQPIGELRDWSYGPFAAAIVDGKLFARGASNSKGDLIVRLAAVEAFQKTFGKLPVCLRFIVEGEDGLGSPSLHQFAREHSELLEAEGCIWDEGRVDEQNRLIVSLGFKGICFVELRAHGARRDIHSKWGAIVPNPAWRLTHAVSTITSPGGVITIDGFNSHIAPLTDDDIRLLKRIEFDEANLKEEFGVTGWLGGMRGKVAIREHIFGASCTICAMSAGHSEAAPQTVVPSTASARLDFRLVPELTPAVVVALLRKHLDARGFDDIEIVELASTIPIKSSSKSLVARAVTESAESLYGANPIVYPLDPASGPAGVLCGISNPPTPIVSFGTSCAASNPHGPDENIRIDDLIQSIKFFGRVIHYLGQQYVKTKSGNRDTRELVRTRS